MTTILEINHQLPTGGRFLHGGVYEGYSLVGDLAGTTFLIGVVWAVVRRYIQRPYRIRIKSKPEHAVILAVFLSFGITGFLTEAYRIAIMDRPDFEKWSFVGYPLSAVIENTSHLEGWHQAWWIVHVLTFCVFLAILSVTMLRHIFTSPLNMYLRDRAAQGRHEADAEPDGDRAGELRRLHHRGFHLEAAPRHGRLHDVRPVHERVPGARHRQAARPSRRSCSRPARSWPARATPRSPHPSGSMVTSR